jgi:hypothetical protein
MSDPVRNLPPHVQAVPDANLKNVRQPQAPRRDMQREWAARLDRAHSVDQSKMPDWKDPRTG